MPTPTIHISYNDYYSDSDSDEPVVSYNDNIRPSELIKSTKHCNSSDTDSDGENHILASINEQREIKKKTPEAIRKSLTSFSHRIRILPESVKNTYINKNIEFDELKTCSKIKPFIGVTSTILITVGCILAI